MSSCQCILMFHISSLVHNWVAAKPRCINIRPLFAEFMVLIRKFAGWNAGGWVIIITIVYILYSNNIQRSFQNYIIVRLQNPGVYGSYNLKALGYGTQAKRGHY